MAVETVERIARNAVLGGYGEVLKNRHVHLGLSMDCDQPYGFTLHGRYSATHGKRVKPITVTGVSRCRVCLPCKHRRSMFWTGRAITEWNQARMTLFGTITLGVDEHLRLDQLALLRLASKRVDFSKLSPDEIFTERARQFGFELQRYLKRLRKGDADHVKPKIRYLICAEMHESERTSPEMRGRPHYHMLLHWVGGGALVNGNPSIAISEGSDGEWEMRKVKTSKGWQPLAFVRDDAFIRKNWTLGFTKFQWAHNANSAAYVCKYLTKSLAVRVRASQYYGLREGDASQATLSERREGSEPMMGSVNMTPTEAAAPPPPQGTD